MAITLPRWMGPVETLVTGMFTVNTQDDRAVLSCPMCSTQFTLPPRCGIDQAGRTQYAVRCESDTCSFWDFVLLESIWS